MDTRARLQLHSILAATVLGLGLALVAMMVLTEGEPGALPLGLVLAGALWLVVTRLRRRRLAH